MLWKELSGRSRKPKFAATAHSILISAASLGLNHPALGAKAYPEVTLRFCRLPLVTFPHGPEAIHLGVLMRIRYGLDARKEIDLRWNFHENSQGPERYKNCIAFSMFSDAFHQLKCHSRRQQRQREKKTLYRPGYPSIHRCSNCFAASVSRVQVPEF